jgi:hypothetical protein
VELLLTEKEGGQGTTLVYVRPSSLISIDDGNPGLLAALALSHKRNDVFGVGFKPAHIIGKCVQGAGDIAPVWSRN